MRFYRMHQFVKTVVRRLFQEKEWMMMKKQMVYTMIFLLMMLLSACDNNDYDQDKSAEVKIYYIDTNSSKIVSESYTPNESEKEKLVEELLIALKQGPKNVIYKSALPDTVTIKGFKIDGDRLIINFDVAYNDLKGIPEVLCRATIVKTLSQVNGVEYIEFNVNDQPLKDSNGVVISRPMTDEDFIENIGDETNYKVALYFTDEGGKVLIDYITNVYYTGSSSIEELVMNQLINGPTEIGLYRTIPEGTILLDISTKDGICNVDFNEKFLEDITNVDDEVVIYSVVNTLVELPNINKVQFTINGEVQKTYREDIAFDTFFERNLTLLKDSK